jgi:hypothetical protein
LTAASPVRGYLAAGSCPRASEGARQSGNPADLGHRIQAVLDAMKERSLPLPGVWVSERFGTLAAKAGLPPVRFHDLRHGAAYQFAG